MKSIQNFLGLFAGVLALVGVVSSGGEGDTRKISEQFINNTLNLAIQSTNVNDFDAADHRKQKQIVNEYFQDITEIDTQVFDENTDGIIDKVVISFKGDRIDLPDEGFFDKHKIDGGCATNIEIAATQDPAKLNDRYAVTKKPDIYVEKEVVIYYGENPTIYYLGDSISYIETYNHNSDFNPSIEECLYESRVNEIAEDLANIES